MFKRLTNTVLTTLVVCTAGANTVAWAADPPGTDPKIATNIVLTGCLHGGERARQFVLVDVTEKTASGAMTAAASAIYMLDSKKDMKQLVGELVDIHGVVVSRDSRRGTVRIAVGNDSEKSTSVQVETASGSNAATKDYAGKSEGAGDSVIEVSRVVYRVNVDSINAAANQNGQACK